MQISSESFINVLTEQVKNLTIENAQLRAIIFDLKADTKEIDKDNLDDEHD